MRGVVGLLLASACSFHASDPASPPAPDAAATVPDGGGSALVVCPTDYVAVGTLPARYHWSES